jgi:cytochrome P450
MPSFVDEAIRWTTPVRHFMRSATQDYELRGQTIKKDDWLMLLYPSGNRDEEVFDEPFSFKVDRSPNKLLSFGFGAHVCIGQHLAKMEMRALFDELIPRLQSIEFDGQPRLSAANFVNGPKKMPVRYKIN